MSAPIIPFPTRSVPLYRFPDDPDAAAAVIANLERQGVEYHVPVEVRQRLWARGGASARLAQRINLDAARRLA